MNRLQERRAQRFQAAEPSPAVGGADVAEVFDIEPESSEAGDTAPAPDEAAELLPPAGSAATTPSEDTAAPPAGEWFDMADAPLTGAPIVLLGPANEVQEAVWLMKRRYDFSAMRWRIEGAFYVYNAGGARVAFEPIAWTRTNW